MVEKAAEKLMVTARAIRIIPPPPASVDDMHSGLSDGNGYEDQRGEYVDPGLLHSIHRLKK